MSESEVANHAKLMLFFRPFSPARSQQMEQRRPLRGTCFATDDDDDPVIRFVWQAQGSRRGCR